MKKSVYTSLAAALVLAGCQAPAAPPPATLEVDPEEQDFTMAEAPALLEAAEREARAELLTLPNTYHVLGAEEGISEAPVEEVRASSVRNDYFRLSYATDDNEHSAWSPETDDEDPTLTFHIAEAALLSRMTLKLSPPGVTMDIEARMHGGEWQTVATGVAPSVYEQMAVVDLPAFEADYVRVTFNRVNGADVLLCDMRWLGVPAPTPTPEPEDECLYEVEGVGKLSGSCPAFFAFKAYEMSGRDKGFVAVKIRGDRYVGRVTHVEQQGDTLTLSGRLAGSNEPFTLVAEDDRRDHLTFLVCDEVIAEGSLRCGDIDVNDDCRDGDKGGECKTVRW